MADEILPESQPPEYSEDRFWDKLKGFARVAGERVVENALQLYYALQSSQTPAWAKTVIMGALAYFIWPFDAVPDAFPAVGFTDDLGALVAALITVRAYITDEVRTQARAKMNQWFGTKDKETKSETIE